MKKKLALLLAAVMLITAALPMNLLAATYDHLTTYSLNHGRGTLMPDTGNLISGVTGQLGPGNLRYTSLPSTIPAAPYSESYNTITSSPANSSWNTLANNGDGMYLVLEFPTGYATSNATESFKINLENAVWYFYDHGSNLYTNQDGTARGWNKTYSDLLLGSNGAGNMQNTLTTTGTHQWRAALGSTGTTTNVDWLSLDAYATAIPDGSPVAVVYDGVMSALNGLAATTAGSYNSYLDSYTTAVTTYFGNNWKFADGTANAVINAERVAMVTVARDLFAYLWGQAATANAALNVNLVTANNYDREATPTVSVHTSVLASIVANASHATTTDPYGVLYNAQRGNTGSARLYTAQPSAYFAPLASSAPLVNTLGVTPEFAAGDADKTVTLPVTLLNAFGDIINSRTITNKGVTYEIGTAAAANAAFGILNTDNNTQLNQSAAFAAIDALPTVATSKTAYMAVGDPGTLANGLAAAPGVVVANLPLAFANVDNVTNAITTNWPTYENLVRQATTDTALTMVDGIFDDMETQLGLLKATTTNNQYNVVVNGAGLTSAGLFAARLDSSSTFTGTSTSVGTGIAANYAEAATQWARINGAYRKSDSVAIPYTLNVSQGVDKGKTATVQFNPSNNGTGIQAGDVIIIPLAIKTLGDQNDVNYTITDSTGAVSPANVKLISSSGARTGYTSSSFASVANAASGRIYLNDLIIQEKSLGVLRDGTFYVIPPAGYDALIVPQNLQATFTYGLHSATQQTGKGDTTWITYTNNLNINGNPSESSSANPRNVVAISIRGFETNRSVLGTLRISGIALNPRTNDADLYDNIGDKYVWLWNASRFTANGGTGAPLTTAQLNAGFVVTDMGLTTATDQASLLAASRQQWSIGYTADPADAHYSGKTWEDVSVVTISENTYNSWYAKQDTTFTLVDENGDSLEGRVKFSGVDILADNLWTVYNVRFPNTSGTGYNPYSYGSTYENWDKNDNGTGAPLDYPNVAFSRDGSKLTLTDLYTSSSAALTNAGYSSSDVLAKMKLGIYLSAEANFEGEVWLQMGGPAVTDATTVEAGGMVKLADFYPPVNISTETTEVQISYQKWNVADVVITENFEQVGYSAFEAGKKVRIGLGEYGNGRLTDYLYFTPVAKADVTFAGDPNFNISEVTMVSLATGNNNIYTGITQRVIEFTVMRKSNTAGSTITLTNLEVNTNRSVPSGNYDLLVGGDSIVDNWITPNTNYLYLYDRYDIFGVVEPDYVKVVTETVNVQTQNTVRLHSGSNIIQVNGVDEEIPVPVLNVDGRMYVPLRFAAVALNVPDKNIFFDDGTRKVFIETNERTVTFQQDSPMYTINGVELSMNEGGVEAVAFIDPQTDRIYIPVRFLAYALNVLVDYDEETGDAILNAK